MTDRVLRMVGNAHIDPVWLWQWPEGLAEVRATFRSALDRIAEYPDFIFTAASAAHYAWVERTDPAMFDEIRIRVEEGRWELAGGWWVEPDCNLPGGESFVRQALLGQRFFRSRFGRTATVGYNVDSFGHAATLPQLLRRAGLDAYVFMRPQPHEMELPGEVFWWESPDGSRVLAARLPHEYCGPRGTLDAYVDAALAKLPEGWSESMLFYGVGNHGGGPTRANIDSLHAIDGSPARPRLVLSSPERYFGRVREAVARGEVHLPVWRGDLQHHARGCYSAHSGIKRWDRESERALVTAEALEAVVGLELGDFDGGRPADDDAPRTEFEQAWRNVAFNEFHDILAGTAIEPAYDDARDAHGEARAVAARAANAAIQRIARLIALPVDPETRPMVVVNPHPWPVAAVVELETGRVSDEDVLVDDGDRAVPHQRVQSLATTSDWRRRIAFRAELPPLGYRTYRMVSGTRAAAAGSASATDLVADDTHLENEHLRVEVDPASGWIRSLVDRGSGADLVGDGLARAIVLDDPSDTWSHDLVGYDSVVGAFVPASIRLVEAGPVRATIRVDGRWGDSRLVLDLSLAAGSRALQIGATLDWREHRRLLKLRFGTSVDPSTAEATAGIAFGAVARPTTGSEEPGGAWADLSGAIGGRHAGLLVVNDAKPALDVHGADLGITIVRSPIYAHHDPRLADETGELFSYQDQGVQRVRLSLVPHPGGPASVVPARAAAELAQLPISLLESFHDGPLPLAASFGHVTPESVVAAAIKRAEDGDGTIVRLVETTGSAARAHVALPRGRSFDADLGAWEVRTYRVPDDRTAPATETDLLERALVPAEPRPSEGVAEVRRPA